MPTFNAIAIDLFAPGEVTPQGYRYVLTVVDLCTKWVMFVPVRTKYPSEILSVLLSSWFHLHGLPEFILSDKGKEFLGVATVVCEMLGVKQIKTTPYHPRTNGLCESQHKMLTSELKIRSARPTAPRWTELLTEISFCQNVTPSRAMGGVSPFEMVFGRKPRLAPEDICFPAHARPDPIPAKAAHGQYVQRKQDLLEHTRFRALEHVQEAAEDRREAHDKKRQHVTAARDPLRFVPGMIVCVNKPTKTMQKLNFQWSGPEYVVVSVAPNTCKVRHLASQKGVKVAELEHVGDISTTVINKKMMRPYEVSLGFFLGAKVYKLFEKEGVDKWFEGTVDQVVQDADEVCWHVTYSDFDEEELNLQQLAGVLGYHPMVDAVGDLEVPEVGTFVWFAEGNHPRLGRVSSVDPTLPRPVTVDVFAPRGGARSLAAASFEMMRDEAGETTSKRITIQQIRLRFDSLTARGYLTTRDRGKLRRLWNS